MAITENDVRLVRQRLYCIEQEDISKADAIWKYLTVDRGLELEDVPVRELAAGQAERWYIPASVQNVTLLVRDDERNLNREPIWRLPVDLDGRELGWAEKCESVPVELEGVAL